MILGLSVVSTVFFLPPFPSVRVKGLTNCCGLDVCFVCPGLDIRLGWSDECVSDFIRIRYIPRLSFT